MAAEENSNTLIKRAEIKTDKPAPGMHVKRITAFVTLITAAWLGFAVTRSITRPLGRLAVAVNALARGEFKHQIAEEGKGELADLARGFNETGRELHSLYGATRDGEAQFRSLSERLMNAQEDERRRIARELHDDFSQQIAALSLFVGKLKRDLPEPEVLLREQTDQLHQKLVKLAESARNMSHELHPAVLEHSGVAAALRSYCSEFTSLSGVKVTLETDDKFSDLPPQLALCIYRIAQEALQNVAPHSGATDARVELRRQNGSVLFAISDSGRGFDAGRTAAKRELGLVSMEERARLVHGTLRVESAPNQGTRRWVSIPLAGPLSEA